MLKILSGILKVIVVIVCGPLFLVFWLLLQIVSIIGLFTLHITFPLEWVLSALAALVGLPLEWALDKEIIPRDDDYDRYF